MNEKSLDVLKQYDIDVYKTIMIKENWFSKTGKLAKIEGSI